MWCLEGSRFILLHVGVLLPSALLSLTFPPKWSCGMSLTIDSGVISPSSSSSHLRCLLPAVLLVSPTRPHFLPSCVSCPSRTLPLPGPESPHTGRPRSPLPGRGPAYGHCPHFPPRTPVGSDIRAPSDLSIVPEAPQSRSGCTSSSSFWNL